LWVLCFLFFFGPLESWDGWENIDVTD